MKLVRTVAIAACFSLAVSSAASAAENAVFLNAPAELNSATPKFAGQFQLKVQLSEGRGLARALLDVGVNQDDAAAAARLAAGHLGAGAGGCFATVSIERDASGLQSLMRVQLSTEARQMVIERRGSELAVASDNPTSKSPALV
jgi:hypothetical protein